MADDDRNAGGFSDEEYDRFFSEKVRITACPACGADDLHWFANMGRKNGIPVLFAVQEKPVSFEPNSRMALAYLECASCGYLMPFNQNTIARWIRQHFRKEK